MTHEPELVLDRNVLTSISIASIMGDRPALMRLVGAMQKLSRPKRAEVVKKGRYAKAGKTARLRRLAREANAEARKLKKAGK